MSKAEIFFSIALLIIVGTFGFSVVHGAPKSDYKPADVSTYQREETIIPADQAVRDEIILSSREELLKRLPNLDEIAAEKEAAKSETEITEVNEMPQTKRLYECIPLSEKVQTALFNKCDQTGIPYHLVLGVIEQESNFNLNADNGTSYGLMQLNRDYFPSNLDEIGNLETGIEYLHTCIVKSGYDIGKALTIYNAGHDTGSRTYSDAVFQKVWQWQDKMKAEDSCR